MFTMGQAWLRPLVMGIVAIGCIALSGGTVSAQTMGVVTANRVNIRDAASQTASNVLYMVDNGQEVEILNVENNYYQVNVKNDASVYIASEYVKVTRVSGVVTVDSAFVYAIPDEQESPVSLCNANETLTVTASCGDWYMVSQNGVDGYILKQQVQIPSFAVLAEKKPPKIGGGSVSGDLTDDIITYAKEFLGTRYVYGSMSPQKGFDCSGFVSYVMKNFDISLSRSSSSMASSGMVVSRDELQKCDLIFFATTGSGNNGKISHVGMYIGDGKFIHASSWGEGVVITNLNDKYYSSRYVKATRVL